MNDPKRESRIETEPSIGGSEATTLTVKGDGLGDYVINVQCNSKERPDELYLNMTSGDARYAWAAVDANQLRDAIDRAVGPREEPEGVKPYRAKDRDRLLRHIEDLEATLTRRNVRHERDQGLIRNLTQKLIDLEAKAAEKKTAEEYLELAWEAAIIPPDGVLHQGERYILRHSHGGFSTGVAHTERITSLSRLLEPRPEPTAESVAEKHGLEEWEIELLRGGC